MAKLFANKFDLDQLPDPKKPKQDIQQGSTTVQRTLDREFITNPNTQVNKIESGDRITDPKLDIKPIKQGDKITNPDTTIKIVNQGSMITDPQLEIDPVVSGDRITNPNIRVEPVEPIDINTQRLNARFRDIDSQKNAMSTSDEILESQGVSKSSAEQYVSKTKTEPFGEKSVEQGSTNVKPPDITEEKVSPVDIKKIDQGSMITDPKVEISKVDQGSKITNPNTEVQKIQPGDRIVDPNTIVKPIAVGDRTTNPNTIIVPVKTDEFIVNPNTVIAKVKDGDRIVDPNTVIKKVNADEKIVNPNIQPQQSKEIDPSKSIPINTKGIGVTGLFPKTISLKNRLEQSKLGTTRHLPEYILSDQNTGVLTIKNPKVIEKTSNIAIQKTQYENSVLNQGGVEDLFKGITSFINPIKYGDKEVNQGSIEIKNNQKFEEKTSPVEIKRVAVGERTIDPKTKITKVQPGERTIDPNTKIQTITPGERTIDPEIKVKLVEPGERTVDPKTAITPIVPGERTIDPKLEIKPIVPGDRIVDPKLEIKPVVAGERTVDPKLIIPLVEPGSRTIDPKTTVRPVEPGERTTIVENRLYLFPQVDNKVFFTQEPRVFVNVFDIFPSDGIIPFAGDIINPPPIYDSLAIFPGTEIPQFVERTGVAYTNLYNTEFKYNVDNTTSKLKTAGEGSGPTPTYIEEARIEGGYTDTVKPVVFPPAQYGDPNLPGGYRVLNYGEIQRRRTDNPNKGLDFSYEDRSGGLKPINQRLGMPDKGADTINTSYDATANDLVTVKLRSRRDDLTLQFRSFIKSFSDNYTPNYSDVNYIGRPDTLKVFKGTVRQISLAFTLPVMSADELKVVYLKLNSLVKIATMGKKGSTYMQGPFLLLTVGGWCKETPVIVNSLKYDTQPLEYTWDIIHEVPQIVDISLDFTALADNTGEGTYSDGTFIQYGTL